MILLEKVGLLKTTNWTKEQVAVHAAKFYAASCTLVNIASSAGLCAGVSSFSPVQFIPVMIIKSHWVIHYTRFLTDSHNK